MKEGFIVYRFLQFVSFVVKNNPCLFTASLAFSPLLSSLQLTSILLLLVPGPEREGRKQEKLT
jgi:hypothetical protein